MPGGPWRAVAAFSVLALLWPAFAQDRPQPPRWEWNTDGDLEGWGRTNSVSEPEVVGGLLRMRMIAPDPWIVGPGIGVDAARYPFLNLRLRINHTGGGSIYWATAEDPQFSQAKMVRFSVTSPTDFTEALLDLRGHPEWTGTITQLRLDPIDLYPTAVRGQQIEVDYLRFMADAERPPDVTAGPLLGARRVLLPPGEPFELRLELCNAGGQAATGMRTDLTLPEDAVQARALSQPPAQIGPNAAVSLAWSVTPRRPGPLPAAVTVRFANHPPVYAALRSFVLPSQMPEAGARLQADAIELILPRYAFGYGPVFVRTEDDAGLPWAVLPSPAALFYLDPEGVLRAWEATPAEVETIAAEGQTTGLRLKASGRGVDGTELSAEIRIARSGDRGAVRLTHELQASRPIRVMVFHGPTLYIGEPAGGIAKDEAIFPGLEWLVGEEQSSSELDAHGPDHLRYVPHPNKVTVPAMATRRRDTLLALLWDPRREWAPGENRPSGVFAVPNTLEGRDDQLLALMAPSVPRYLPENATLATQPYLLKPGDVLSLEGYLLSRSTRAAADVVLDWIHLFGLPQPAPSPHPRPADAFAFALNGYLGALWVPEKKGWTNSYGPPGSVAAHWPFMRDMTIAERILPPGELRDQVRETLAQARSTAGRHSGLEVAAYEGDLLDFVHSRWRSSILRSIEAQRPDGGWGFAPDPERRGTAHDPFTLGTPGQVELGTCARPAADILRFARIAADHQALDAGLRALERMTRFEVPRAAQVWEVPVHTPDIVAASHAVRAFLEGFRVTGDRQWLDQAVRWARLGLPFLYLWDSGEYPYMRYGSIPVFGSSWYTGAWFGRIVQWNGLEHAAAILELAAYDDSLPWRTIAEGILASAANQQAQDGPEKGLYPDACNLMTGTKADYYVSPYQYCETALALMGIAVNPATAFVDAPGLARGKLAITAPGQIAEAAYDTAHRALAFTCRFADDGKHHVLIAGAPPVVAVEVNGEVWPPAEDLREGSGSAWLQNTAAEMVEVRVGAGQQARVSLTFAR